MIGNPTYEELEQRVQQLEKAEFERKIAVKALEESKKKLRNYSNQTEQLSLAAVSMLSMKDEQKIFDNISKAIVEHSDFQRVIISLFKEETPYRDIIGFAGLDDEIVDKLREIEMPSSWYDGVFKQGEKIGRLSYYIPHNIKEILNQKAVIYGKGAIPASNNSWHPEDNLFVKMINEKGELIGVFSVDESKSGLKPLDETVRPLEIFAILISQIIILNQARKKQKKLQLQLNHAQKMEAIGTLAGGVAHDLNNVLSAQVGYPDLLLMDLPEDSPLTEPILMIKESGLKAAAIVQDLLTMARRGVIVEDIINLNQVVDTFFNSPQYERIKMFNPDVIIKSNLDTDLLNIMGSTVHLFKILMNLLHNAAEAMPHGGDIIISTKGEYIDRQLKGGDPVKEGDYAILSVSDTGIGIDPKDIERIFEPFFTKKVMGRSGTGLGMAVVWGTVKDHKGYIDVQSTKDQGTTFTLYFPVVREEIEEKKKALPMEKYMGRGESLLIVDDVETQRNIASDMLVKLGYSVVSAASGEQAVDYIKENSADLIILDMIMGLGIDGCETYKQILKIYPEQKAVITSGFSETARVKEAQSLGAGEYIKKPYTFEKIGLAVKRELER
jgi:signal transduction histidine kinase/ActR/RegA family two-component response regulator